MANRRRLNAVFLSLSFSAFFITAGCDADSVLERYTLNDIPALTGEAPKNIILVIGDGMGPEQIRAGGYYVNGKEGSLSFENTSDFPVFAKMGTRNAWGKTTDSAASATAMATGHKVANRILSLEIPGSGDSLKTLAEAARTAGKSVGLVTTDNVCSATPAAFVSHHDDRYEYEVIASRILEFMPEVLFGGGAAPGISYAEASGYTVVGTAAGMFALSSDSNEPVYGRFGNDMMPYIEHRGDLPTLAEMAEKALDRLEENTDGFLLLVENELTDEASHLNNEDLLVKEIAELDKAVVSILAWAEDKTDTLIVVTADHETGGAHVLTGCDSGEIPFVGWFTKGHTSRDVNLYARGVDAETFSLVLENTDIYRIMIRYFPDS